MWEIVLFILHIILGLPLAFASFAQHLLVNMTLYRSALAVAAAALVSITQAWNIELPPCIEPFKPFVYSGCFQDGNPNALVFRSSLDQQDMTVEKCIADCKGMWPLSEKNSLRRLQYAHSSNNGVN